MAKNKTPLPPGTFWEALGIYYQEDVPKYHIDGVACSKEERERHVLMADALSKEWLKNKTIKKRIKERIKKDDSSNKV